VIIIKNSTIKNLLQSFLLLAGGAILGMMYQGIRNIPSEQMSESSLFLVGPIISALIVIGFGLYLTLKVK